LRVLTGARGLAALLCLATFGGAGCGSCGAPSAGPAEAAAPEAVEPPVPAPAGLLAEIVVRAPDTAWGKLQLGVSGAVALLPPTVGELAVAFAGIDGTAAQLVDGKGTAYVVLGDGGAAEPLAWVVAFPVADARAASSMLFGNEPLDAGDASAGRYVPKDAAGMRVLSSASRPTSVTVALARGPHPRAWLVFASTEEALGRLGPYAVRTLPTKAPPPEPGAVVADVPSSALAGPLSAWLGARWGQTRAWLEARDEEQRAKHGGRAPDFGDPRAIVEAFDGLITGRIALLRAARGARVVLDVGDDEVHAELDLTPGTDPASVSQLAAMAPGDTVPLAALPSDAAVALLVRDGAASRGEDAASLEATLVKTLGGRLHEEDTRAVHAAVADWAHARGDWWTGALAWGTSDASRGLWLRTPSASADASLHAVREIVDLSHRRAFEDLLAASLHLSPAAVRSVDAPPVARASLAVFGQQIAGGAGKPDGAGAPGIAWGVHEGTLLVAAGTSAPQLLSAEAAPPRKLGDDPRSARALAALGQKATLVLFGEPLRLDPTRGEPDSRAPAVLAWGRKGDDAWGRLELADVLLRELLRLKAGL
jgi:hypothetical protein